LGHVQINIPQGHREVEDDGAGVEDKLKALATGHVEVPHGVAVEGRHGHRRLRTHNYTSLIFVFKLINKNRPAWRRRSPTAGRARPCCTSPSGKQRS
jgi:hypothetical protein